MQTKEPQTPSPVDVEKALVVSQGIVEQEAGVPFDSPSIRAEFEANYNLTRLVDRITTALQSRPVVVSGETEWIQKASREIYDFVNEHNMRPSELEIAEIISRHCGAKGAQG